jgi:hypothetical protein
MQEILDDQLSNIDFSDLKFKGKLYGKGYKREQAADFLKKIRVLLFILPILVFYPILTDFVLHDIVNYDLLFERIVFSIIFMLSGIFFYKNPLIAIIAAMLSPILMITFMLLTGSYTIRLLGFYGAIIALLIVGIYYHFQEKKIKKELIAEFKNGNEDAVLVA